MAVVLVRLRLAIERHRRGGNPTLQALSLWGRWVAALLLGLGAGAGVAALDGIGSPGDLGLVMLFSTVFVGWVALPLLVPGVGDDAVDPARLEQFPITPRDQVVGLLLGGLLTPTALFTVLFALGGVAASNISLLARLGAALSAIVFTALCVAGSRAVTAAATSTLASRHGRDLMYTLAGSLALGLVLVMRVAGGEESDRVVAAWSGWANSPLQAVLGWLPPGAMGQSLVDLRAGSFGAATVHGLVGLVGVAACCWLWAWAIRRRVRGGGGAAHEHRRRARGAEELALLVEPARVLGAGPASAAMSQHLRSFFFRSPRAAQSIVAGGISGGVLGHSVVGEQSLMLGGATFALMMGVLLGSSVFGYDGPGFGYLVQSGAPLREVVRGKAVALWLVASVVTIGFTVVEAVINGVLGDLGPAILVAIAMAGWSVGVGTWCGVVAPRDQEHRSGGAARVLGMLLLGMAIAAAGMGAMVLVLRSIGIDGWVAGLLSAVVGVLGGMAATRLAGSHAARRPLAMARALGV